MLAHELPGTRDLDVVITGVTNEDRVVQLLIRDGQLQVAASSTKHIPTVPVKEQKQPGKRELGTPTAKPYQVQRMQFRGEIPALLMACQQVS